MVLVYGPPYTPNYPNTVIVESYGRNYGEKQMIQSSSGPARVTTASSPGEGLAMQQYQQVEAVRTERVEIMEPQPETVFVQEYDYDGIPRRRRMYRNNSWLVLMGILIIVIVLIIILGALAGAGKFRRRPHYHRVIIYG
jgi:hypothetical protein